MFLRKAEEDSSGPTDEEEQAFQTQLGGRSDIGAGTGAGKQRGSFSEEEETQREDEPSAAFEYRAFLSKYNQLRRITVKLDSIDKIAKEVEIRSTTDIGANPSGFATSNDRAYGDISTKKDSDLLITLVGGLSTNKDYFDTLPHVENDIMLSLKPTKKMDRETRMMIDRDKKEDLSLLPLKVVLLKALEKRWDTNKGELNFYDVLSALHTNRFGATPASKRGQIKVKYLSQIRGAKRKILQIGTKKSIYDSRLKELRELINTFRNFKDDKDKLEAKINIINESLSVDVSEMISDKLSEVNDTIRTLISERKTEEIREQFGVLEDIRNNPDKYIKEVKDRLTKELEETTEELDNLVQEIEDIQVFEKDLIQLVKVLKKVKSSNLPDVSELKKRIASNKKSLDRMKGRDKPNAQEIREMENKVKNQEKGLKETLKLNKALSGASTSILDTNEKLKNFPETIDKLSDMEIDDGRKLARTLVLFTFKDMISRQEVPPQMLDEFMPETTVVERGIEKIKQLDEYDTALLGAADTAITIQESLDKLSKALEELSTVDINFNFGGKIAVLDLTEETQ
jgi:DNA repair exonuclease SbcCD ATPase subunit